ncbi:Type II secretory pathway, ATPase PulE/Tfp pilus assembly pathway, ATPase PilB [Methylacidiphilum infernorum V4]|uniref:Type II secretory pathway, ATPase PulE/Tfp pilus assembly pathway, ATPase PilB n=2 Tax=Candidatus Methylacidiphilum infernorum TaxID=511746 RepID=B3DV85_METI4|nr:Type II secretory pathway, ATPase PulE/Tfp pilus assembly pathway, ATPase PilB [Methylacidiphilum infernorum V4]
MSLIQPIPIPLRRIDFMGVHKLHTESPNIYLIGKMKEKRLCAPPDAENEQRKTFLEAQNQLEEFLLKERLVIAENLKEWKKTDGFFDLEKALLRHSSLFSWEKWAESFNHRNGWPPLYPTDRDHPLPPSAFHPSAKKLEKEFNAMILWDNPIYIIGLLNPFRLNEVEFYVATAFPDKLRIFYLLYPADLANLILKRERGIEGFPDWEEANKEEWLKLLRLEPSFYPRVADILEEILLGKEPKMVIPEGAVQSCAVIESFENALLWRKSQTWSWVITPEAFNSKLEDRLIEALKTKIQLVICSPSHFQKLSERAKKGTKAKGILSGDPLHIREWPQIDPNNFNKTGISLYHALMSSAIDRGASDISLEPKEEKVRVRFRIDGDYYEQAPLSRIQYQILLDRIKLFGNMAPDQKGIFQDGSSSYLYKGIRYDQRYSIVVGQGMEEYTAIRIFSSRIPILDDLNLPPLEYSFLLWFLQNGQGMFVSTGPTGSGKTTTLYAMLNYISSTRKKIITIENPVEKYFPDAVQIEVREKAAITFASALRGIVRQDPDIIMIGEIRDRESAQIAIDAALTGHLVFSSIHATDPVGVMERMVQSFGIDRLAVSYALKLAVSQRLVSKLCPYCKKLRKATAEDLRYFPHCQVAEPTVAEAPGCQACRGTGTAGRMPILELLPFDSEIISLIENGASPNRLRAHNENRGFKPLSVQAAELFFTGTISKEEALLLLSSRSYSSLF